MKFKLYTLAFAGVLLSACHSGFTNENGVVFTTDKLVGHYKMNVTPFVDEEVKKSGNDLTTNIAAAIIENTVSVDLFFTSNGKGKWRVSLDAGAFGRLFSLNKKEDIDFTYKLKDDSILIIHPNQKEEGQMTVRSFTDSFDYIELVNKSDNTKVELTKVSD